MKALLTLAGILAALAAAAPAALGAKPQGTTFITDTLGGNRHPTHSLGYRFITDTLGGNGGAHLVATADGGFQWGDAGVGAAASAGAILVLLGGTLILLRRKGRLAI